VCGSLLLVIDYCFLNSDFRKSPVETLKFLNGTVLLERCATVTIKCKGYRSMPTFIIAVEYIWKGVEDLIPFVNQYTLIDSGNTM